MKKTIATALLLLAVLATTAYAATFKNWVFSHIGIAPPGIPTMTIYNAHGEQETLVVTLDQWLYASTLPAGHFVTAHDANGDGDTCDVAEGEYVVFGPTK